jgi:hypothetical protein
MRWMRMCVRWRISLSELMPSGASPLPLFECISSVGGGLSPITPAATPMHGLHETQSPNALASPGAKDEKSPLSSVR